MQRTRLYGKSAPDACPSCASVFRGLSVLHRVPCDTNLTQVEGAERMLGEVIGEGKGKRSGRRVIATEPAFKIEVSFADVSKLLGVPGMNIGTYVSHPKPDGSLGGLGEGVFATMEGETVTWQGLGVGQFLE